MKKCIVILISIFVVLLMVSCDAPTPTSWQGNYQKLTDIYFLDATVVGAITASADPNTVASTDERVVITAEVVDMIGRPLQGAEVTFSTDTGFFRSSDFGPSKIFTDLSDSEGKAYAHLLQVGRTCTVKVESGGLFVRVVIETN